MSLISEGYENWFTPYEIALLYCILTLSNRGTILL